MITTKILNSIETLLFFFKKKKIIVFCRAYYGDEWMLQSLKSVEKYVDKILIILSDRTWGNLEDKGDDIKKLLDDDTLLLDKYFYYTGSWDNQVTQQNDALNYIRKYHSECTHILFMDTDEIYEKQDIKRLLKYAKHYKTFNKGIRVKMYTYIKSVYYRVFPLEEYMPLALLPIRDYISFTDVRSVNSCNMYNSDVMMHHFSLVRKSDERISRKLKNRAKSYKRVENWYERFYLNFSSSIKNFHPIIGNESQWSSVEKVTSNDLPKGVEKIYLSWKR